MSVASAVVSQKFVGAGQTIFNFNVPAEASADIQAFLEVDASGLLTPLLLVAGAPASGQYSVGGASGAWVVTTGDAVAIGNNLLVQRATPKTQSRQFENNAPFQAKSIENGLDRSTMIDQEILDRDILKIPFPVKKARASKAVGFDANGDWSVFDLLTSGLPTIDIQNYLTRAQRSRAPGLYNVGLKSSVAANALTIALSQDDGATDPAAGAFSSIAIFRSAVLTSGAVAVGEATAALSLVVDSGSTLGLLSGIEDYIHVYGLLNAGVMELLVITGRLLDERILHSTTAIGVAGTADSRGVPYSTTARANVPVKYLGTLTATEAVTGTWNAAPTVTAIGYIDPSYDPSTWRNGFYNMAFNGVVGANALTLSLTQAFDGTSAPGTGKNRVGIEFRSPTLTSSARVYAEAKAAVTTVISSGSTAGFFAAKAEKMHLYAAYNAGAIALCWSGTNKWSEADLQTTTAEGGAGAADAKDVLYSTNVLNNVPIRYLGFMLLTEATPGTWATNPSQIVLAPIVPTQIENIVRADTGFNGAKHGSTDTFIVRLTNATTKGTAITRTSTAANGDIYTINEDGFYKIVFFDRHSAAWWTGISINSNQLTTSISNAGFTLANRLVVVTATANTHALCVWEGFLRVGDAIRMHDDSSTTISENQTQFSIQKVA